MGIDGTQKSSDWLRHAIMNFIHSGGRDERASNHTTFVVDQLGRSIVAGEYPAGTMIPLDPDLCEMFGVSRTVVREAKKTLIAKGLIQSKAKVGTHVRAGDDWNMFDEDVLMWHAAQKNPTQFYDELFEIRMIFEPAAAAKAATMANVVDSARLTQLCDDMESARDRAAFAVADYEFHKQILKLSRNRFLHSLGDMVQTALYSLFMTEANDAFPQSKVDVARKHRVIATAIAHGEAALARAAMTEVISDSFNRTRVRCEVR
ncbi:transcriptional regulator, GntR family [Loktanella atrilutea]|uniref:Transcriptional regulator, GntR family n=1 Tax=Loktanella atrilutea TaxID=366533 RepID=A0A1M5D852_LOKAT|nr:FadR/GntR family transcriptional regulator [Loktanella atrilutea]SHF63186.1 transcriptional regulator, GntR family [Loktanella atrilutea]